MGTALDWTSSRVNWYGTVRGRLGFLFTPTLLVYGTGGLAYGGVNTTVNHNTLMVSFPLTSQGLAPGSASFSDTRVGWTAGGGLEWMFMPNWSAKVEYLYTDLGTTSLSTFGARPLDYSHPLYRHRQLHVHRGDPLAHRPRRRELSLQLGRCSGRREILIKSTPRSLEARPMWPGFFDSKTAENWMSKS